MDRIKQNTRFLIILFLAGQCLAVPGDFELSRDGTGIIWNNNSFTFSIRGSGSMSESVTYIWPPADGVSGQAIVTNGSGILGWTTPSPSDVHDILSVIHDSTTNSVTRGSLIYGNSTSKWDELAISSSIGSILTKVVGTDGTDSGFRTLDNFADDLLGSNTDGSSGASFVGIPTIGDAATNDQLEEAFDVWNSAGLISGGVVSDGSGGEVDVASLQGAVRITDSHKASLVSFGLAASPGHAIDVNTIRYVGVEYNNGTPQILVKDTDDWDTHSEFALAVVVNESGTLHIANNPEQISNFGMHALHRFYETLPLQRAERLGGLILGESGGGNQFVTLTAGEIYDRINEFEIAAFDSSGADRFDSYSSAGLESSDDQVWDANNYDNSGTLTALSNNRYAVLWWYVETDGDMVCVYGTAQYVTAGQAEQETVPITIPDRLTAHGKLVGRYIIKQGVTTAVSVQTVFETTFAATGVTDHGNLGGLADNDHPVYVPYDGAVSNINLNTRSITLAGDIIAGQSGMTWGTSAVTDMTLAGPENTSLRPAVNNWLYLGEAGFQWKGIFGVDMTASATVQAEHLYSTDDLQVDDDASITGELDAVSGAFVVNSTGIGYGTTPSTFIMELEGGAAAAQITRLSANASGAGFNFRKARGTPGSPAAVVNSDEIFKMFGFSYIDGAYRNNVIITSTIDGVPSASSYPSALKFLVTKAGSTSTTERMKMFNTGRTVWTYNEDAMTGANIDVSNLGQLLRIPADLNADGVGIGFGVSSNIANIGAAIVHQRDGSQSFGSLLFGTKPSGGGAGADLAVRMKITAAGDVEMANNVTMVSGKVLTTETIRAVDGTGLLLQNDTPTTVVTIEDAGTLAIAGATTISSTLDVTGNIDPTSYETTRGGFLDENDMASNSATSTVSQQSLIAFVNTQIAATAEPTLEIWADIAQWMSDSFFLDLIEWPAAQDNSHLVAPLLGKGVIGDRVWFTFRLPHDFVTLDAAVIITDSDDTDATTSYAVWGTWGAIGEQPDGTTDMDVTTANITADRWNEIDVSAALTGVAAGDHITVHFQNRQTVVEDMTLYVLGMRISYDDE